MSNYLKGDKLKHIIACFIIYVLTFIGLTAIHVHGAVGWAFGITILIGVLKECIDPLIGGTFDFDDMKADVIGASFGFTLGVLYLIFFS